MAREVLRSWDLVHSHGTVCSPGLLKNLGVSSFFENQLYEKVNIEYLLDSNERVSTCAFTFITCLMLYIYCQKIVLTSDTFRLFQVLFVGAIFTFTKIIFIMVTLLL